MYIYNVTTNIEDKAHKKWLQWMKTIHIPQVLSTGKFLSAKMTKVLAEEGTGQTYSVQYTAASKEILQAYYEEDAPKLREDALQLFADQIISFRTELEVIDEFFVHRNTATHHLFTYGTLKEKEVQLGVFSRLLGGFDDILHGHKISEYKVAGLYPTIETSQNSEDLIKGTVYVLTDEELQKADYYEGDAYERREVLLSSGKKAWVYLAK
ncbi:DUF4286 family protein [Maribacter cobaltidurans]|uniref:DUF4286 family protein n=1 Tax=Maribacter cobaltidurans TaxID=1178778 RepID=UPI0019B04480|nr:DUF4286 family protein [Maribacter cobaltidurans]GGD92675.1 hypothetical protein GCM10011412_33290 [Maribacter cobaltidurans]